MSNEILYMGGIFNFTDPLFGWQIYIWSWVLAVIFAVLSWVIWRFVIWAPYKPLWGLYDAFKSASSAAFIFNRGLVSELLSERQAKCIFDYSKWKYEGLGRLQSYFFNYASAFLDDLSWSKALIYKLGNRNMDVDIAKKMQNYEWESAYSVNTGGIQVDMILDSDRWSVKGSPQNKAIIAQCETWNELNPTNQIHSFPKYQRMVSENQIPPASGITPTIIVPWSRIDSAFPIRVGNNTMSGARRQAAIEMEDDDTNILTKYILPVLGGCFGFAVILLLIRVGMHFYK